MSKHVPSPALDWFGALDPASQTAIAFSALALAAILGNLIARRTRRRRWRPKGADRWWKAVARPAAPSNPIHQMEAVALVDFETWPLLNREEARLLPVLETALNRHGDGHRIMAQTCLGEVLRPKPSSASSVLRDAAYAAINAKRLDFSVIDRYGRLVAAIEYHGTGHYHAHSFLRDAVKREALRKAGVPMIEVQPDFRAEEVIARLRAVLVPEASRGPPWHEH